MFNQLKKLVQDKYKELSSGNQQAFYKAVDRDKIWELYLDTFPEATRQEHNCNCCKSFLRQFGGIVFIKDLKVHSIWEIDIDLIDAEYKASVIAVRDYIKSLPITDVFLSEVQKAGTDKSPDPKKNLIWEHFSLLLNNNCVASKDDISARCGRLRTAKETTQRALEELTVDAAETILELIAQNSLYRGPEFTTGVQTLLRAKKKYALLKDNREKDAFAWITSITDPGVSGIRNSAIGTLLINLSEGMDLDMALRKYEVVTAPANYKRPTAAITPKMVEQAKEKIQELGFLDALDRRYANATDIDVNNILFTSTNSTITDVFDDMAKGTLVNPKKLSKVEEVTIDDFINKIVPTAKSIEVLLENRHMPNFMSLLTAQHADAKSMFKWGNPFSLAYTGGVADSMKERVKAAGGNINAVLRFSIQWNDEDTPYTRDYDAHAHEPGGKHIYYGSGYRGQGDHAPRTPYSGNLDVDRTGGSDVMVENITWTELNRMRDGKYKLRIHNFTGAPNKGFKAQIECQGETYDFHYTKSFLGYVDVAEVTLTKGVFTVETKLEANSNVTSKEKWGVKTNTFTKVNSIMFSPNYWNDKTGNKHFLFILDGCISDESPRPFFNEFLTQELNEHRKVFEVMAGKLKVPDSTNQLSGVGFSDTQSNELIVKVTGSFARTLKIKI